MVDINIDNTAQRERLRALVNRLSEDELRRTVEHGWTVAATLAHLAFWDHMRAAQLRAWVERGESPASVHPDPVNEAVRTLAHAIPPSAVGGLVLDAAEAADAQVAGLSGEQVAAAIEAGLERLVKRSLHRSSHLDQIEQAVG